MAAGLRLPTWLGDRFETWHSQLDLLWGRLLYVVVGHLSRLWSRDDRLWLFGARDRRRSDRRRRPAGRVLFTDLPRVGHLVRRATRRGNRSHTRRRVIRLPPTASDATSSSVPSNQEPRQPPSTARSDSTYLSRTHSSRPARPTVPHQHRRQLTCRKYIFLTYSDRTN